MQKRYEIHKGSYVTILKRDLDVPDSPDFVLLYIAYICFEAEPNSKAVDLAEL